jgi:hypothetical protein
VQQLGVDAEPLHALEEHGEHSAVGWRAPISPLPYGSVQLRPYSFAASGCTVAIIQAVVCLQPAWGLVFLASGLPMGWEQPAPLACSGICRGPCSRLLAARLCPGAQSAPVDTRLGFHTTLAGWRLPLVPWTFVNPSHRPCRSPYIPHDIPFNVGSRLVPYLHIAVVSDFARKVVIYASSGLRNSCVR